MYSSWRQIHPQLHASKSLFLALSLSKPLFSLFSNLLQLLYLLSSSIVCASLVSLVFPHHLRFHSFFNSIVPATDFFLDDSSLSSVDNKPAVFHYFLFTIFRYTGAKRIWRWGRRGLPTFQDHRWSCSSGSLVTPATFPYVILFWICRARCPTLVCMSFSLYCSWLFSCC